MIETNKILQTDLLDILFDGRNKQYGAYELRKQYSKRMIIAVIVMIICCLLFFLLYAFASGKNVSRDVPILDSVRLVELKREEKKPEPILPQPKPVQPQVKTIKFATPKITNEEVKPDEKPPEMKDLDESKIATFTKDGVVDPDIIAPPIVDDKKVIELPKKSDDDGDGYHIPVQIESEYPGGIESWRRYLGRNLRYPTVAVENEIEGTVIVQFLVDKTGLVSDVEAVSGPNELRDEAVRVIKKSGKWTPAIQNGHHVKSYKKQPITFILEKQ